MDFTHVISTVVDSPHVCRNSQIKLCLNGLIDFTELFGMGIQADIPLPLFHQMYILEIF
ncbi:MAG: hypothetical protein PCFJNLEI_01370 [Verrucomicrobiae bacterium]|nr:hypothetical protein [Verrucomicrobiae bacterium]